MQAVSRGMDAMERAWGQSEGPREVGISRSSGDRGLCRPAPHLVHSGKDPAVALAEGTDLSHLPRCIVGEAKLHKLALQGRGGGQNPTHSRRPGRENHSEDPRSDPLGQPWSLHAPG